MPINWLIQSEIAHYWQWCHLQPGYKDDTIWSIKAGNLRRFLGYL